MVFLWLKVTFGYLEVKTKKLQNRPHSLLSPKYKNQHAFDEARHQSLLNRKCSHISKYHSLKISSESMRVQATYETKPIYYQFHKIGPKISKLQTHLRVSRIKLYMENACYLVST